MAIRRPTIVLLLACTVLLSSCATQSIEAPAARTGQPGRSGEIGQAGQAAQLGQAGQVGKDAGVAPTTLAASAAAAPPVANAAAGRSLGPTGEWVAVQEHARQQLGMRRALAEHLDRRVHVWRVGSKLATAGAELCDDDRYRFGFLAVDRSMFGPHWAPVAARIGIGPGVRVWSVREDLAAPWALLARGDRIVRIGDEPVDDYAAFKDAMSRPSKKGALTMTVERADRRHADVALAGVPACDFRASVFEDATPISYVRGNGVYVTTGLLEFLRSDDELAVVLAHEMAHDSLGHFTRKQVQAVAGLLAEVAITVFTGIGTGGALARLGEMAFAGGMERDADELGLYMAGRAGYDVSVAPELWKRFAAELPIDDQAGIVMRHPLSLKRVDKMGRVSTEIEYKIAEGSELVPGQKRADTEIASAQTVDELDGLEDLEPGVVHVVPVEALLPLEADE